MSYNMIDSSVHSARLQKIKAIFFDLHHTITKTSFGFTELTRKAVAKVGMNIDNISDEKIKVITTKMNDWLRDFQLENDVDIHWGTEPEQWLQTNRRFLEFLGIENVSEETLANFERAWKDLTKSDWESLADGAQEVLRELRDRGYILGICTRRHDDPKDLLKKWGILDLMASVQWTGVPGYAKPSPYTLLQAAHDIKINPRLCAYIGNLVDADIMAAKSAEMLPILTTWANPEEKEKASEDTIVLDNLSQLCDIFEGPSS